MPENVHWEFFWGQVAKELLRTQESEIFVYKFSEIFCGKKWFKSASSISKIVGDTFF